MLEVGQQGMHVTLEESCYGNNYFAKTCGWTERKQTLPDDAYLKFVLFGTLEKLDYWRMYAEVCRVDLQQIITALTVDSRSMKHTLV